MFYIKNYEKIVKTAMCNPAIYNINTLINIQVN